MNLSDLRTEVQARGFDFLSALRIDRYVNVAYSEICELEDWPFLLTSMTGTAPLSIADLRTIESVTDTTLKRKLTPVDRRSLSDRFPDLTATGSPCEYFLTGQTAIGVFPANTSDTLEVRYWKVPAELSGDSDVPVVPARFHYAIVDFAVARAMADESDYQGAEATRGEGMRLVELMRQNLLGGQSDRPLLIDVGDSYDW